MNRETGREESGRKESGRKGTGRKGTGRERPRRDAYRAFRPITTRWADNDVYAHVNNVVYYSFFDTVVNGWLVERGLLEIGRSASIGLVAETGCRYFAPLAFPDLVTGALRAERIGTTSVTYAIAIFRAEEDEAAAAGHFVHVWVDAETRRPVPLPEPLRSALVEIA